MASISGPSRGALDHKYYDILEICPVATKQQIKDAYKRLAILKHPDKNLGDPASACATFQQLQTAYDTLSEPTLRAKYDASILRCSTIRAVTPHNRCPLPRVPGWRRPTPPQRPSPPARPTAPKSRFPKTHFPARDANRPLCLSQGWYEISINRSVKKEKIYRDELTSLFDQKNWRAWIDLHDMLEVELIYQATLRRVLSAIIAKLFDLHH